MDDKLTIHPKSVHAAQGSMDYYEDGDTELLRYMKNEGASLLQTVEALAAKYNVPLKYAKRTISLKSRRWEYVCKDGVVATFDKNGNEID